MFLDLAEILSDSVADAKMSSITWIIIILIVVSIMITVTEVSLRFGILEKSKSGGSGSSSPETIVKLRGPDWLAQNNITLEELRLWTAQLSEQEKGAICGAEIVGNTFAGV